MYRYWILVPERRSATTGEIVASSSEVGPFVTSILGSANREITEEEAVNYVLRVHGVKPARMEKFVEKEKNHDSI